MYILLNPVDVRYTISSFYGNRKNPFDKSSNIKNMHYGIDFACPSGTDLHSAHSGEVIWTGYNHTYGNTIIIEHQGGYLTLSAHLSEIKVHTGDYVYRGQIIGKTGNTGNSTGPHLHFETIDGNIYYEKLPIKKHIRNAGKYKINSHQSRPIGVAGDVGRYNAYTGEVLPTKQEIQQQQLSTLQNNHPHYTRETLPTKYYIWHTQGDDKVRSSHEELDGTIHSVDEGIFPGEDYNCRCWAEEISDEEALR